MLNKIVSLSISMILVSSLTACGSRLESDPILNNQIYNSMSADGEISNDESLMADDQESISDSTIDKAIEDAVIDNQVSTQIADFTDDEIDELVRTNEFPFLIDDESAFNTKSLSSFLGLDKIKAKINDWKQKRAQKKLDKLEKFEVANPELSRDLIQLAQLKGSAKKAKLKELKTKYPASFKKLTNKIAIHRWVKFEKKNPGLANDLMNLSTLPKEQRTARLEELKKKYPKFFN